jgi:putative endonuclease
MIDSRTRQSAYRYGLSAEKYAGIYLRCKGYRIIAERYRNMQGEIDLLALKGDTLVAVEVKARKTIKDCEETVTPWKQKKIIRAMQGLLGSQSKIAGLAVQGDRNIRFDVIWIAPWQWPVHIQDAWRAE